MSMAAIVQTYGETRRLAIAGSNLAAGDFRLQKLIEPLKKSAVKAPVFGKVADAIAKVVEGPTTETAQSLLELSTLIHAILYTQGETGASGKLTLIKTPEFVVPASTGSARMMKPLVESLTTTGSGRLELIREAFERGAFKDLRLVNPAIHAIDDSYGEIGDLIADQILPSYGAAIYPELRSKFDPKGKGGHVRRLRLMYRLDPSATQELVEESLESGSKEMKIAALLCLRDSKKHLPYMLEQATAKAKEVRAAALRGIAKFKDDEVVATLQKALAGKDVALAAGPTSQNTSPKLRKFVLEDAQRQADQLFATTEKAKLNSRLQHFHTFLSCFRARQDKMSVGFLISCFERRDELAKLEGERSGQDITWKVAVLTIMTGSKPAMNRLVDAHQTLDAELLACAFVAATRTRTATQVFELFAPYLNLEVGARKRSPLSVRRKREAIRDLLRGRSQHSYEHAYDLDERAWEAEYGRQLGCLLRDTELDKRWLDSAAEAGDLELVAALLRPKHKGSQQLLQTTFDDLMKKGEVNHELHNVLNMMVRSQYDDAMLVDNFLAALNKLGSQKRRHYYVWWMGRLIPEMPRQAAPRIEAALTTLPEVVVDDLAPYVDELKRKKCTA